MHDRDYEPARRVLEVVVVSPHTDQHPSKFFGQFDQFPTGYRLGMSRAAISLSHVVGMATDPVRRPSTKPLMVDYQLATVASSAFTADAHLNFLSFQAFPDPESRNPQIAVLYLCLEGV